VAREQKASAAPRKQGAKRGSAPRRGPPRVEPLRSESPRNVRLQRPKGSASLSVSARRDRLRERFLAARARAHAIGARLRKPSAILFKVLLVCTAIAGALGLGHLLQHHLTTSPAFAIDKIEVKGLVRMERPELLDAAGIELGRNVFARGPAEVKARLLKHPWIASASVSRRLPGTFSLEVREREPIALLVVEPCSDAHLRSETDTGCDDGSSLYLLSDDGKLFKRFDAKDPVDLPVITGVDRDRFGSDPEFHKTILLEVAQLVHDYRSQGLWQKLPISEIHVEPSDGFSLYVGEELTLVRLGAAPFAQKLPKMKKVFARLSREHATAEYVYLDNEERPDRVTVRLR
jgi:cell division protein FtsQ